MKTILLPLLVITGLLAACTQEQGEVIATVNGKAITESEFDAYLKNKRLHVRNDKHRLALLEQYASREALSRVIENGLDAQAKAANQAELESFRRQMVISRYFDNYLRQAVSEEKISNYYATHQDQYSDTRMHVAHILFRLKKGMSETERKARLTLAHEAWSKLKAGEDFGKVANDYSEDRISAKKGGDLGWLKQGAISPVFSKKIFAMKKGDVSEPFETAFGYHIVTVLDGPRVVKKPFEAVKGDIRYQLRQQARQAELERLKAQAKIEIVK